MKTAKNVTTIDQFVKTCYESDNTQAVAEKLGLEPKQVAGRMSNLRRKGIVFPAYARSRQVIDVDSINATMKKAYGEKFAAAQKIAVQKKAVQVKSKK